MTNTQARMMPPPCCGASVESADNVPLSCLQVDTLFDEGDSSADLRNVTLGVEYLQSYEHMGRARVRLSHLSCMLFC
jgi:hypothetical protein